ncbi:MAG: hypothetical protein CME25_23090 [Gemmatimonadetes bacterium]|nr:hypothetical protein [Gemmatimonadota bacterium]
MTMSGESALKGIRARGHGLPIVVMTGHVELDQKERLSALGVNTVLPKPFKLAALIEAVRTLA